MLKTKKEVVQGVQPDNDECDITIKFHDGLFVWEPSDLEEITTN